MPPGFQIGPLYVHFYGIILMTGALAGGWLASVLARRRALDPEIVWDGLIWVLVGGILGARLWHIFTPPHSMIEQGITTTWYLLHPLDMLAIWRGGLGIPGAIVGGGFALYLFCRSRKFNFLQWADIAAPGLALGQVIGRWGNFVNQEVYGQPTNLPWAVHIDLRNRLPGFEAIETYHPLFLYESLWSLGNLVVLLWLFRRRSDSLKPGDLLLIYLVIYPVGRFLLEFLRLDPSVVGLVNANQVLMALTALSSAALLLWRRRHRVATPDPELPQITDTPSDTES